jgi:hypothetical protein
MRLLLRLLLWLRLLLLRLSLLLLRLSLLLLWLRLLLLRLSLLLLRLSLLLLRLSLLLLRLSLLRLLLLWLRLLLLRLSLVLLWLRLLLLRLSLLLLWLRLLLLRLRLLLLRLRLLLLRLRLLLLRLRLLLLLRLRLLLLRLRLSLLLLRLSLLLLLVLLLLLLRLRRWRRRGRHLGQVLVHALLLVNALPASPAVHTFLVWVVGALQQSERHGTGQTAGSQGAWPASEPASVTRDCQCLAAATQRAPAWLPRPGGCGLLGPGPGPQTIFCALSGGARPAWPAPAARPAHDRGGGGAGGRWATRGALHDNCVWAGSWGAVQRRSPC